MIYVKEFTYDEYSAFSANSYIAYDNNRNAFIIDPGCKDPRRDEFIKENNLKVINIILTHGHFDHIRGLNDAYEKYKAKILISEEDKIFLNDANINLSRYFGDYYTFGPLSDGIIETFNKETKLVVGLEEPLHIIETPFHTPGSVCLYFEKSKILFSGDTLFKTSIGRTDFLLGDASLVKSSLAKLKDLPGDTIIYPGHNDVTNLEFELKNNQFFKY